MSCINLQLFFVIVRIVQKFVWDTPKILGNTSVSDAWMCFFYFSFLCCYFYFYYYYLLFVVQLSLMMMLVARYTYNIKKFMFQKPEICVGILFSKSVHIYKNCQVCGFVVQISFILISEEWRWIKNQAQNSNESPWICS